VFAGGQDIRQEDSSSWNLSGLGDRPLCVESVMNLSLVVTIISESGLKKPQLIFLTLRHRASFILGQAFHYSPENAFYIFNQQIYFII